jgi:polyphosphate kinase
MDRNLDRRVEAVVPVEDSEARARLVEIVEVMLADDRRSWQLGPDAQWRRIEELQGRAGTVDTFEVLKARALASGQVAQPHRPHSGSGSLDPRA